MRIQEKVKAWQGRALLGALWLIKLVCIPPFLRAKVYRALIIRLIKRSNLFDKAYYLENNSDVAQKGTPALRHYVLYGDREGRFPMPLFDPGYYRSHAKGGTKKVNALLHYAYIGRYQRISPSQWFDVDFYLSNNKDVARAGSDPLLHYLNWGGLEGRSPCPQFDGLYYLRANPNVLDLRINPLIHYLFYGRLEGRNTLPGLDKSPPLDSEASEISLLNSPSEEPWFGLRHRANIGNAKVDVIVPVYKARIETLRCIYSVLVAKCETDFELVVINDASSDQELVEDLHRLANQGLFTLLSNASNRGFVYTANRGITRHKKRDVILLNSDTEVYDGWLDRLSRAAYRHEHTGTVTPLSNNATICSYPRFLHDNPFPLELGYSELDALTARINANIEAEAPTGVGFCFYIKRACLQAVGLFDEKTFGKGYGEENDFCQKAIKKGWRNIIAADIFVRHLGAASFQGEKAQRVQSALKILGKRYPRYAKEVNNFIHADPLSGARRSLDLARMQRMRRDKNVLIVSHSRGGGTERHVQEDILRLTQEGYGVFILRPVAGDLEKVTLCHSQIKSFPNISPFILANTAILKEALEGLGITEIHTHSTVDFDPASPQYLLTIATALGAYLEVNLHDYKVICPRVNLADEKGFYCGEPPEAVCNQCLVERGSDFNVLDISVWRSMHEQALRGADKVLVPDSDVSERMLRYFSGINFEVSPHEKIELNAIKAKKPRLHADEKLRVLVIGAIGKLKGFNVILSCAKNARQNNLPIEFIVMGYSMNDKLIEEAGVYVTGKYQEHEALDTIRNLNCHVVWLPSVWPETYSYTLSLALQVNFPVFAFDIGAIARRVKEAGMGEMLMPLSWADDPDNINLQFLKFRENCL